MKEKTKKDIEYGVDILTGMRPTGDLTIANYVGAVKPLLNLQKKYSSCMIFVADLHALTDHEFVTVEATTSDVAVDYLALGLDPEKTTIFAQSSIASEVLLLTSFLLRHVTVSELLRVPTLKDKLKDKQRAVEANALLANYPVIMAADILLQRTRYVPIGKDQVPHLELTRLVAERFNKKYGYVFPIPSVQEVEPLVLKSLDGVGKMSKTNPSQAIFLTDTPDVVAKKIRKAKTAFDGEMTETLESHVNLVRGLAKNDKDILLLGKILESHMCGEKVMGDFKNLMVSVVVEFLEVFQEKRKELLSDSTYIPSVLEQGAKVARENGRKTLDYMYEALRKGKV